MGYLVLGAIALAVRSMGKAAADDRAERRRTGEPFFQFNENSDHRRIARWLDGDPDAWKPEDR